MSVCLFVSRDFLLYKLINLSIKLKQNLNFLFRIGVNGFDNPKRDPKTAEFKNQIGQGCKIKMDEAGNVLVNSFKVKNSKI